MGGPRRRSDGQTRRGSVVSGVAVALGCVLFLGGFGWGAVLYRPYTVPTDSMAPTIARDDRVLAKRIDGSEVHRGDVVVFRDSVWGSLPMVKRVVGVGGDKVACCDEQGRLTVNGKAVDEPYLARQGPASPSTFSATVSADQLFLLGDNRDTSVDSRRHLTDGNQGTVPRKAVDARVEAAVWPLGSLGMLEQATGFNTLPGGASEQGPLRLITGMVLVGAALILGGAAYGPVARLTRGTRKPPRAGAGNGARSTTAHGARSGAEHGAAVPARRPGTDQNALGRGTGRGAAAAPGAPAAGQSTAGDAPAEGPRGGKGTARSSG